MNSSLYIGATGMKGLAEGMQVTSNNLANISTIGYKQQNILFSDMLSQSQAGMGEWWNNQEDSRVAVGQVGMGLQVEAIRTIFTEGTKESTNNMTDLAINGKGFFQVSDDSGNLFYTRAGDFQTDSEGVWRTPSGLALNGYQIAADGTRGDLTSVQIDKFSTMPPRATTSLELSLNLNLDTDKSESAENPFFAMLGNYDATQKTPLDANQYSTSQQMTFYDAEGKSHTCTAYFDSAPSSGNQKFVEFVLANDEIAANVDEDGNPVAGQAGDGLLLAGVLEFDATGKLVNVAAFNPAEAGTKDLSKWVPADMENGSPAIQIGDSSITVSFGLQAEGGWENAPESAAAVGADYRNLPGLGEGVISSDYPTTAYATTSMTNSYKQNGYGEGTLNNLSVGTDGVITGTYSNGQNMDLWEIPVARFTSEDGLYREGGNLFSATDESGEMTLGTAGTENYGTILAYNIEGSNVDMSQEFVNLIITQRGFQSNSKVVTTSDEMLKKAMELKQR